jgi:hypothetical protein
MKKLLLFEEFSKSYGEKITLDQFKNIKPDQIINYEGSRYTVIKNDGFILTLKGEKGNFTVNYSMFNRAGSIAEAEVLEQDMTGAEKVLWKATYDFYLKHIDDNPKEAEKAAEEKIEKTRKLKSHPGIIRK